MDYKEARVYLDEAAKYGSVLGLTTMTELLKRLGNPQDDLKFVDIAGTNGKATRAGVFALIRFKRSRIQRWDDYISPTLFSYRERIQVNEAYITKEAVARLTGSGKRSGQYEYGGRTSGRADRS